LQIKTHWKR